MFSIARQICASLIFFKALTILYLGSSRSVHAFTTCSLLVRIPSASSRSNGGICCTPRQGKVKGDYSPEVIYRAPSREDIFACSAIEAASYPDDEAATLDSLTLRQKVALDYFQCAIVDDDIIGFVCGTRCHHFEEDSMSTHDPTGPLLAIHSVVVKEEYRRQGIATTMLQNYLGTIRSVSAKNNNNHTPIQSIVLLAKSHLLGFYVDCGFQVNRPSPIVHGRDIWYECEQKVMASSDVIKSLPAANESWFCKTETFKKPFPQVKPHLEAHKTWVETLRSKDKVCITSGYRVDSQGRPGGGGLMFLAAKDYEEALKLVLQDPLVANDCVDWQLNGWIAQVGDVQMR